MGLPINIEQLIHGEVIEWERLEFKKGWNPDEIIHTMVAFANDLNNWGGGYIIIGIETSEGKPILPPIGLKQSEIDYIQLKLLELCHRIRPHYFPVVQPSMIDGKHILVIWVPGGDTRPYQAPISIGKESNYAYFIRRNSSTIVAKPSDVAHLHLVAAKVPFDDRINHNAKIDDLKPSLIKDFLKLVKSDLYKEMDSLSFEEIARNMQIARGPKEYFKPVNIGLLMFNENPEFFFPYTQIEIVHFHDEVGDRFSEKIFKGPLYIQLKNALEYIKNQFIRVEIKKIKGQAEAFRFHNYPYEAIEESLANGVYHKDYEKRSPIEIRILHDKIEILSFPGPLPPTTKETLNSGKTSNRDYRNRRIGDFLKELDLTEGRCTGIRKIQNAMKENGSPPAIFDTDDDRSYFMTILPVHPQVIIDKMKQKTSNIPQELSRKITSLGKRPKEVIMKNIIIELCLYGPLTSQEIADILGKKNKNHLVRSYLNPLVQAGRLKLSYPEDPRHPNQSYKS